MTARIKPGSLCIVLVGELRGQVVTARNYWLSKNFLNTAEGSGPLKNVWVWRVTLKNGTTRWKSGKWIAYLPRQLMPINDPDADTSDTTDKDLRITEKVR